MKIGSLFSGYGGLDMGVQAVLGGETAWFVEYDDAPSRILAHHWPEVPNYGDVTTTDWASVEPVDILTGGFPCQDVSLAGLRRGLKAGTRSGLWSEYARAIDILRPSLVVIENVRGLLSAEATGAMEPDPWSMGDGPDEPALRALGAVLGDLAELGYDAEWLGLRAADAGAPHGRFRVFILAHPEGQPWRFGDGDDVRVGGGADGRGSTPGGGAVEDPDIATSGERRLPAPGQEEGGRARADAGGRGGASATDPYGEGFSSLGRFDTERRDVDGRGSEDSVWGAYQPAIRRWEVATGRCAPAATRPDGRDGGHRLNPEFVEWMMGLPAGHVTGVGLTREQELKALGNGVVPQQAALAVAVLTSHSASKDS